MIVWFTGLPASGKTTLANAVRRRLYGRPVVLLDGDEVRAVLRPPPGYDELARDQLYETLGNLALLLAAQGLIVLVAATAHRRSWRDRIRAGGQLIEVHVATPLDECRRRDPKGLYRDVPGALPGVDVTYEAPASPEVVASGGEDEAAVEAIVRRLS